MGPLDQIFQLYFQSLNLKTFLHLDCHQLHNFQLLNFEIFSARVELPCNCVMNINALLKPVIFEEYKILDEIKYFFQLLYRKDGILTQIVKYSLKILWRNKHGKVKR